MNRATFILTVSVFVISISCAKKSSSPANTGGPGNAAQGEALNASTRTPFLTFLRSHHPDLDSTVAFYAEEDLDLDGCVEAVVGLGREGAISSLFVLRDCKGIIEQIGDNLADWSYGCTSVEVVRLKGMRGRYINMVLSNGGGMTGFSLVGINGNSIRSIESATSANGSGFDRLEDFDQDGIIDGYSQSRPNPHYLDIPITLVYELANGAFLKKNGRVDSDLPPYPDSAIGVIGQFLRLDYVNEWFDSIPSPLEERLSTLYPSRSTAVSVKAFPSFA